MYSRRALNEELLTRDETTDDDREERAEAPGEKSGVVSSEGGVGTVNEDEFETGLIEPELPLEPGPWIP